MRSKSEVATRRLPEPIEEALKLSSKTVLCG